MENDERSLYDVIEDYPIHIDQIARSVDMDAGRLAMILAQNGIEGDYSAASRKSVRTMLILLN
jgi:predicted Rossmann fold nucleotide-binding protein DprA/Smf involved in DNA uptake